MTPIGVLGDEATDNLERRTGELELILLSERASNVASTRILDKWAFMNAFFNESRVPYTCK